MIMQRNYFRGSELEGRIMSSWLGRIVDPIEVGVVESGVALPSIESLLPIALVCGVSIVCAALWLFTVYEYSWSKRRDQLASKD